MTDVNMAAQETRLYSQTPTDDRGNFHYQGDLHRAGEALPDLCRRIERHLAATFSESRFAVRGETFAGGRKVLVELLDHAADLTADTDRSAFQITVRDQIERFGFTRSNLYQDYSSCAFYNEVRIGAAYWTALAARRGMADPVEQKLTLAAFRKTVKPGDTLKLIHAPWPTRNLGVTRVVEKIRSADLVLGGSHLNYPRAAGFACDGRLVRIALGDERNPDAHLLYEWERKAA
ncbi:MULTISPECIES: hypothetical protein [unclassified Sphingomonas]|uniref:hypothetical protein n=1 Tax=unclassified Sphingomonas TaxID=196159 RepID=UPI002860D0A7|nr:MULTISPECIES: hypothetical protein [unclassified Sphingomonas]MDR6116585.1 hypothetical protein [Sphingomonas sp. SORGH_AS_0789]MDR6149738.1 hypothetical protein [Sphingomonas sp. SORGH_AS_0742]